MQALGLIWAVVVALILIGIFLALAFFVSVISYGWLTSIAPEAELARLSPWRRRVVMVRALVVLCSFWVVLLAVNSGARQHRNPDTGPEAFNYWRPTLRRLCGLPER